MNSVCAIQVKQADFTKRGIMTKPEILQIRQPQISFEGGSVKWFDDTRLLKKETVNYQYMGENQKNEYGRYVPDYNELINNASCEDEIQAIKGVRDFYNKASQKETLKHNAHFTFNTVFTNYNRRTGKWQILQLHTQVSPIEKIRVMVG